MTKEQVVENSKLIAKYIGWKYEPFKKGSNIKAGWYKPSVFIKGMNKHPDGKFWKHVCRNHHQLRFYNSFDALIPAIEKLESEDLSEYSYQWGEHNNFMCVIFVRWGDESSFDIELQLDPPKIIGKGKGEGIIKDTFKAVSEAIKYLNKLKNE